ncbi:DUF924 domain-containing protein [Synechococcus sp. FGCU-3]|nr:DUF924 domain-containing protein [Synechococcus sp. FGCU3]
MADSVERGVHRSSGSGEFARRHRDVITPFRRFPHRNAASSRESDPESLCFVQMPVALF